MLYVVCPSWPAGHDGHDIEALPENGHANVRNAGTNTDKNYLSL